MKLVSIPDPVLSTQSKPVVNFDKKLHLIIQQMIDVLEAQNDPPGVGLAAPQVGLSYQLFLIKPNKKDKVQVFINPVIKSKLQIPNDKPNSNSKDSKKKDVRLEGCLSIPRIWGEVHRFPKIQIEYQDEKGNKKTEWFSGFKSVIVQHELDHLNGVLFTQRVLEQKGQLYEEKNDELVKIKDLI
ncbi:MAG TPA: peptide deformylase [Candidatus Nitrosocosmicus sp.]|nr:peptide deformylase [Candidatus Nitrosocosmicus sp.]